MRWRVAIAALLPLLVSATAAPRVAQDLILGATLPPRLSDFHFFAGTSASPELLPYRLNTPLFSDYTDKDRFVFVPAGQKMGYRETGVLDLPVGSALIKTFRYGATRIETRVLLHRATGWVALPYVWVGDDAVLKRAGTRVAVNANGKPIDYAVPNVNQCKECHALDGAMTPIGPKARNLNDGVQLASWASAGRIDRLPSAPPRIPRFDDTSAPVAVRARAYLDVNCGHCHNLRGAASNSGLNLTWETTDPTALGIGKHPVAAGRGSGGLEVAIDPGHPERSIIIHRMASVEPGVAMPELGRATVHKEGVALVTAWIAGMKP